ncbi:chloramphenicol phosphotransferase CPT [Actinacidiphila yeochonensis]|uniref:chloramphenicol phosphotransferase CPT n=1 Tax=Actinacidiphila yeochonensis TaxID=89050 RepID=UPI000561599B|nr:chloramphenicol phosphotransferase CPT [Actinacidiphila yeochonensis]
MPVQVIVLNGGSSSGKSTLARALQVELRDPWLTFGTDTLVDALPPRLLAGGSGLLLGSGGEVAAGAEFRRLDAAWTRGLAEVARAGARLIVDEVFLGGADSQKRWRAALGDLEVLWVGVRCAPGTAAAREAARGDRATGMARGQAELVHRGVRYDLEVDTGTASTLECARVIAARVAAG